MSKVNFEDKVDLVDNPTIPEKNKLTAQNINEMKKVINSKADQKDLDIQKNRIDNLAKLGEGSTTGDAELQDIRIDSDGKVYNNAGDAVRGQISELKSDIVNKMTWGLIREGEVFELSTEKEPIKPVPCTGITLDKKTLSFSDLETKQTLIATVEPFDTTDDVIWSIDNEEVATLVNGAITPVANGHAVVTVTCGSYSATCEITVKIITPYTKANLQAYYDFVDYEDDYTGEIANKYSESNTGLIAKVLKYNGGTSTVGGIKNGMLRSGHKEIGANYHDDYMQIYNLSTRQFASQYPYTVESYLRVRGRLQSNGNEGAISYGTTWLAPGNAGLMTTRIEITDEPKSIANISSSKRGTSVYFNSNMHTLRTSGAGGIGINEFTLDESYVIDEYHHYVISVDSELIKIYIDGVLVGEGTATNNDLTDTETTLSFYLEQDIKMVRVYNAILTDEQVSNNYQNTIETYGGEA